MELFRLLTVTTLMIVAGRAQFTVQPVLVKKAEGLEAMYSCRYQAEGLAVTYDWAINSFLVTTDTKTVKARPPSSPGEPTTLTIVATLQYNNSVVQCQANIREGIHLVGSKRSTTATLTVYATAITNVLTAPNTITVMWNALPLTEYCVDITKTTLDSHETIVFDSVCGVANKHIFTYSNHSVCFKFFLTVTPTEREMRGTTSEPDTGFCMNAEAAPSAFPIFDLQTDSLPTDIESLPTSVIAGISGALVVIIMMVIVIVLIIVCVKRGDKGLHSSYINESDSEGGFNLDVCTSIASQKDGVARPDSLECNTANTASVVCINMLSSAYESIALANTGKAPLVITFPSPMIQKDGEAPDLPPAVDT